MNTDWLKNEIEDALEEAGVLVEASREEEVLWAITKRIRRKIVEEYNEAISRLKRVVAGYIEREREEVS